MSAEAAKRVNTFVVTHKVTAAVRREWPDIAAHVEAFPITAIVWRARHQPPLLHDLFGLGALASLDGYQVRHLALMLSSPSHGPWPYPYTGSLPPAQRRSDRDVATLALVREQTRFASDAALIGGPQQSRLWTRYAAVYAAASPALRAAVVCMCTADLVARDADVGRIVLGPSTLVGAGLGTIALGSVRRGTSLPYIGPLVPRSDIQSADAYMAEVGIDLFIDGSYAATSGAAMNNVPPMQDPGACIEVGTDGRITVPYVHVRLLRDVTSEEIFADYDGVAA